MPEPRGFPSFQTFIESIQSEKHSLYAARALTKMPVKSAFDEMRAHILNLYKGAQAPHSFMDESGAIFDCIPIEQQPALRDTAEPVFKAPDLPPQEEAGRPKLRRKETLVGSSLSPTKKDPHGNVMHCPAGTVPIRRITLEELTRFPSLKEYFQKGPNGEGRPPQAREEIEPPGPGASHRWAHAYQNVINGGGHSYVNLWNPSIGPGQIFSLSQHWYVGGSGANLQTVECGWQVYPGRLLDNRTHLFTYFTADAYNTTGCYDLTRPAFVQLSSTFAPGMVLSPTSTIGGSMYIMELSFWHANGRWILYYNGQRGADAIGYYPDSLFNGGALTQHATEIDYGGETVGTTSFPAMGSGRFAHEGWRYAAYQRTIGYWTPQGGTMCNANLTAVQAWPNCYTAEVQMFGDPWYETLWYGGPGGNC